MITFDKWGSGGGSWGPGLSNLPHAERWRAALSQQKQKQFNTINMKWLVNPLEAALWLPLRRTETQDTSANITLPSSWSLWLCLCNGFYLRLVRHRLGKSWLVYIININSGNEIIKKKEWTFSLKERPLLEHSSSVWVTWTRNLPSRSQFCHLIFKDDRGLLANPSNPECSPLAEPLSLGAPAAARHFNL